MSPIVVLVLLCAAEAWLVQARTLLAPQAQGGWGPTIDRVLRFGFDLLAFGAVIGVLPRPLVALVFAANALFYLLVIVHHDFYRQPLSVLVLLTQRREGTRVAHPGLAQLEPWHLVFLGSFAIKLLLLFGAESRPDRDTGFACLALYSLALILVNRFYQPLRRIAIRQTVGGLGAVYGYLPAWSAEYASFEQGTVLTRALARAGEVTDRLTPQETPTPIANCLVFLQIERLDWAVLDFRIRNQEVTPELNRLVPKAMCYAVRPESCRGSSDADFIMLTGRPPSADLPTYKILGYPYVDTLVHRMTGMGFGTTAVHGASGQAFGRRAAFAKMGFERLIFREQFQQTGPTPIAGWSVPDDDLLQFAAMDFSARPGRQFQLVISATSQPPFHNYDRTLARFFPGSESVAELYFDVMHYVDRAIGRYLRSLPAETTVVLYGSQASMTEHSPIGYDQRLGESRELVPFMVLETGRDLAGLQRTRPLAQTGTFTLLDAAQWVRASLELQRVEDQIAGR